MTTAGGGSGNPSGPSSSIQSNQSGAFYGDAGAQYDPSVSSMTISGNIKTGGTLTIKDSDSTLSQAGGWNNDHSLNVTVDATGNFYFLRDIYSEASFCNATTFPLAPLDIRTNISPVMSYFKSGTPAGDSLFSTSDGDLTMNQWLSPDGGNTVYWSWVTKPLTTNIEYARLISSPTVGAIFRLYGAGHLGKSIGLKAPNIVADNIDFQLPGVDGSPGQALITDGNKVLSFGTVSSGVSGSTGTVGITIDGGGSAIVAGSTRSITVPYACTISSWTLISDQSGSIFIHVSTSSSADFIAGRRSNISGTNSPALTSNIYRASSPTSWSQTTLSKGDIVSFVNDSASTLTWANLVLWLVKS